MQQYLDLMRHVRDHGTLKDDRTGTGTTRIWSSNAVRAGGWFSSGHHQENVFEGHYS